MLRTVLIAIAIVFCGCGGSILPTPGDPPFSAERIREATPKGRKYRFKVTPTGQPAAIQEIEFTDVNPTHATMRQRAFDTAGTPTRDEVITLIGWDELESHGRFPAAQTRIEAQSLTVPAGRFDCWVYTVQRDDETVRSWFAHDLPGAPIAQEVSKRGVRLLRMELISHYPGQ
jgi:hypothetical protein